MDLDQLKQLLDLVREHELSEFEIEHEGLRVKIRKDSSGTPVLAFPAAPGAAQPAAAAASSSALGPAAGGLSPAIGDGPSSTESEIELAVVKSPIVGTFYRAPEPGSASFVEIGSTVRKGQVLCIIEAMKLMNEIESEVAGKVAEILVENAQPVEFGQPLYRIEPA